MELAPSVPVPLSSSDEWRWRRVHDALAALPNDQYDRGATACLVLSTMFLFQLVRRVVKHLPVPLSVYVLGELNVFRWQNLVVSWVHACITGIGASTCLLYHWKSMFADMMHFFHWHGFCVCCFATGYFLHDLFDIVYVGRVRQKWDILLHHLAILLAATYIMYNVHAVGYFVLALIVEVNTAFLHVRKLLQMAAYTRHYFVVRANQLLNLVTFLPFRFAPLIYLSYAFRFERHQLPAFCQLFLLISIFTLNVVNLVLLYRLLNADVLPILQRNSRFLRFAKRQNMTNVDNT